MAFVVLLLATKALGEDKQNVINPSNNNSEPIPKPSQSIQILPRAHPIKTPGSITEDLLRQYLEKRNSPLVPYAGQILGSAYWSTIIAICSDEEYDCSVNPYGTNNLWGIMDGSSHLVRYPSLAAGIAAIDAYLDHRNDQGLDTVEKFRTQNLGNGKFRAIYCYDAKSSDHICWGWERKVIQVQTELESLKKKVAPFGAFLFVFQKWRGRYSIRVELPLCGR